jgi:hypothetical protein
MSIKGSLLERKELWNRGKCFPLNKVNRKHVLTVEGNMWIIKA